jgi:hypothetical protein
VTRRGKMRVESSMEANKEENKKKPRGTRKKYSIYLTLV